jgi:hypothetical protein
MVLRMTKRRTHHSWDSPNFELSSHAKPRLSKSGKFHSCGLRISNTQNASISGARDGLFESRTYPCQAPVVMNAPMCILRHRGMMQLRDGGARGGVINQIEKGLTPRELRGRLNKMSIIRRQTIPVPARRRLDLKRLALQWNGPVTFASYPTSPFVPSSDWSTHVHDRNTHGCWWFLR